MSPQPTWQSAAWRAWARDLALDPTQRVLKVVFYITTSSSTTSSPSEEEEAEEEAEAAAEAAAEEAAAAAAAERKVDERMIAQARGALAGGATMLIVDLITRTKKNYNKKDKMDAEEKREGAVRDDDDDDDDDDDAERERERMKVVSSPRPRPTMG